jgi:hypothetical protein
LTISPQKITKSKKPHKQITKLYKKTQKKKKKKKKKKTSNWDNVPSNYQNIVDVPPKPIRQK